MTDLNSPMGLQPQTPRINFTSTLIDNQLNPDVLPQMAINSRQLGADPYIMSDEEVFSAYPQFNWNNEMYSPERKESMKAQFDAFRQYEGMALNAMRNGEYDTTSLIEYPDTPQGRHLAMRMGNGVYGAEAIVTKRLDPTLIYTPFGETYKMFTEAQAARATGVYKTREGTFEKYYRGAPVVWDYNEETNDYFMRELNENEYPSKDRLIGLFGPEKLSGSWLGGVGRGIVSNSVGLTLKGFGALVETFGDLFSPGEDKASDDFGRRMALWGNMVTLQHVNEKKGMFNNMGSFLYTMAGSMAQIGTMFGLGAAVGAAGAALGMGAVAGTAATTAALIVGSAHAIGMEKENMKAMGIDETRGDQAFLLAKGLVTASVERFLGPNKWITFGNKALAPAKIRAARELSEEAVRVSNHWGVKLKALDPTARYYAMKKAGYSAMSKLDDLAYSNKKVKEMLGAGIEEYTEEGVEGVLYSGLNAMHNGVHTLQARNILRHNGNAQYYTETDPQTGYVKHMKKYAEGYTEMIDEELWSEEQEERAYAKHLLSSQARHDTSLGATVSGFGEEGIAAFLGSAAFAAVLPLFRSKMVNDKIRSQENVYQLASWITKQADQEKALSEIRQSYMDLNSQGIFDGDMIDQEGKPLQNIGDPNSRSVQYVNQIMEEIAYAANIITKYKLNDPKLLTRVNLAKDNNALRGVVNAYKQYDEAIEAKKNLPQDAPQEEIDKIDETIKKAQTSIDYFTKPRMSNVNGNETDSWRGNPNASNYHHDRYIMHSVLDKSAEEAYQKWELDNMHASDKTKRQKKDELLLSSAVFATENPLGRTNAMYLVGNYKQASAFIRENFAQAAQAADEAIQAEYDRVARVDQSPIDTLITEVSDLLKIKKGQKVSEIAENHSNAMRRIVEVLSDPKLEGLTDESATKLRSFAALHLNKYQAAVEAYNAFEESEYSELPSEDRPKPLSPKMMREATMGRAEQALDIEGRIKSKVASPRSRQELILDYLVANTPIYEDMNTGGAIADSEQMMGLLKDVQELMLNYATPDQIKDATEKFNFNADNVIQLQLLSAKISQLLDHYNLQQELIDKLADDDIMGEHAYPYTVEGVTSHKKNPAVYDSIRDYYKVLQSYMDAIVERQQEAEIGSPDVREFMIPNQVASQAALLDMLFTEEGQRVHDVIKKAIDAVSDTDTKNKIKAYLDAITKHIAEIHSAAGAILKAANKEVTEDGWHIGIRGLLNQYFSDLQMTPDDQQKKINEIISAIYIPLGKALSAAHNVFKILPLPESAAYDIYHAYVDYSPHYKSSYYTEYNSVPFEKAYDPSVIRTKQDALILNRYRAVQMLSFMNMIRGVDMNQYINESEKYAAQLLANDKDVPTLDQLFASAYIVSYLNNGVMKYPNPSDVMKTDVMYIPLASYALFGSGGSGKTSMVAPLAAHFANMMSEEKRVVIFLTPHEERKGEVEKYFGGNVIVKTHGKFIKEKDVPDGAIVFVDEATAIRPSYHKEFGELVKKKNLKVVMIGDKTQAKPMKEEPYDRDTVIVNKVENVLLANPPLIYTHRAPFGTIQILMDYYKDTINVSNEVPLPLSGFAFWENAYKEKYEDGTERAMNLGVRYMETREHVIEAYIDSLRTMYEDSVLIVRTEEEAREIESLVNKTLSQREITNKTEEAGGDPIKVIIKTAQFDPFQENSRTQSGGQWFHVFSLIDKNDYTDDIDMYVSDMYTVVSRSMASLHLLAPVSSSLRSRAMRANALKNKNEIITKYNPGYRKTKATRNYSELQAASGKITEAKAEKTKAEETPRPVIKPAVFDRKTLVFNEDALAQDPTVMGFIGKIAEIGEKHHGIESADKAVTALALQHKYHAMALRYAVALTRNSSDAQQQRQRVVDAIEKYNEAVEEGARVEKVEEYITWLAERINRGPLGDIFSNPALTLSNVLLVDEDVPKAFNLLGFRVVGISEGKPILDIYFSNISEEAIATSPVVKENAKKAIKILTDKGALINTVTQVTMKNRAFDKNINMIEIPIEELSDVGIATAEQLYSVDRWIGEKETKEVTGRVSLQVNYPYHVAVDTLPGVKAGDVLYYQGAIRNNESYSYVFKDKDGLTVLLPFSQLTDGLFGKIGISLFNAQAIHYAAKNGFYADSNYFPNITAPVAGDFFDFTQNSHLRRRRLLLKAINDVAISEFSLRYHKEKSLAYVKVENGKGTYIENRTYPHVITLALKDKDKEEIIAYLKDNMVALKTWHHNHVTDQDIEELITEIESGTGLEFAQYHRPEFEYPEGKKIQSVEFQPVLWNLIINNGSDADIKREFEKSFKKGSINDTSRDSNVELNVARALFLRDAIARGDENLGDVNFDVNDFWVNGSGYINDSAKKPDITRDNLDKMGIFGALSLETEEQGKVSNVPVLVATRLKENDVRVPISYMTMGMLLDRNIMDSYFAELKASINSFLIENKEDLDELMNHYKDLENGEVFSEDDEKIFKSLSNNLNKEWDKTGIELLLNLNYKTLIDKGKFKSGLGDLAAYVHVKVAQNEKAYVRFNGDINGYTHNLRDRADKALGLLDVLERIASNRTASLLTGMKAFLPANMAMATNFRFMVMDVDYMAQPGLFDQRPKIVSTLESVVSTQTSTQNEGKRSRGNKGLNYIGDNSFELSENKEQVLFTLRDILGDAFVESNNLILGNVEWTHDGAILGKVHKGLMHLYGEDGLYSSRVARHEAMHYIIQYMLSPKERTSILEEARAELRAQGKDDSIKNAHEYIADLFMDQKQSPRNWLQRLYDLVMTFLHRFGLLSYNMQSLMKAANHGVFARKNNNFKYDQDGELVEDDFYADPLLAKITPEQKWWTKEVNKRLEGEVNIFYEDSQRFVVSKIYDKSPVNKNFSQSVIKSWPEVALSVYYNMLDDHRALSTMKFYIKKEEENEFKEVGIYDFDLSLYDDIIDGVYEGKIEYYEKGELKTLPLKITEIVVKAFFLSFVAKPTKAGFNYDILKHEIENILPVNIDNLIKRRNDKRAKILSVDPDQTNPFDSTMAVAPEISVARKEREGKSPSDTISGMIKFILKTTPVYQKKQGQQYGHGIHLNDDNLTGKVGLDEIFIINTLANEAAALKRITGGETNDRLIYALFDRISFLEKITRNREQKNALFTFLVAFGDISYRNLTSKRAALSQGQASFDVIDAGYLRLSRELKTIEYFLKRYEDSRRGISETEFINTELNKRMALVDYEIITKGKTEYYVTPDGEVTVASFVRATREAIIKEQKSLRDIIVSIQQATGTRLIEQGEEITEQVIDKIKRLRTRAKYYHDHIVAPLNGWLNSQYKREQMIVDLEAGKRESIGHEMIDQGKGQVRERLRKQFFIENNGLLAYNEEAYNKLFGSGKFKINEDGVILYRSEQKYIPFWVPNKVEGYSVEPITMRNAVNKFMRELNLQDNTLNVNNLYGRDEQGNRYDDAVNEIVVAKKYKDKESFKYDFRSLVEDVAAILYGVEANDKIVKRERNGIEYKDNGPASQYYEKNNYHKDKYVLEVRDDGNSFVEAELYSPTDMFRFLEAMGTLMSMENLSSANMVYSNPEGKQENSTVFGDRSTDAFGRGKTGLIPGWGKDKMIINPLTKGHYNLRLMDLNGVFGANSGKTFKSMSNKDYVMMLLANFAMDAMELGGKRFTYVFDPHADRGKSNVIEFRHSVDINSAFFIAHKDKGELYDVTVDSSLIDDYHYVLEYYQRQHQESVNRWIDLADKYQIKDETGKLKTDPAAIAEALNARVNGKTEVRTLNTTIDYKIKDGKIVVGNAITLNDGTPETRHIIWKPEHLKKYSEMVSRNTHPERGRNNVSIRNEFEALLSEAMKDSIRELAIVLYDTFGQEGIKTGKNNLFAGINKMSDWHKTDHEVTDEMLDAYLEKNKYKKVETTNKKGEVVIKHQKGKGKLYSRDWIKGLISKAIYDDEFEANLKEIDDSDILMNYRLSKWGHYGKVDKDGNYVKAPNWMTAFFMAYYMASWSTGTMTRGNDLQFKGVADYLKRSVSETTPGQVPIISSPENLIGKPKGLPEIGNVLIVEDRGGSHYLYPEMHDPELRTNGISYSIGPTRRMMEHSGLGQIMGGSMIKDILVDIDHTTGLGQTHKMAKLFINRHLFMNYSDMRDHYKRMIGPVLWEKYRDKLMSDFDQAELEIYNEVTENWNLYKDQYIHYIVHPSAVKYGQRAVIGIDENGEYMDIDAPDAIINRANSISRINFNNYRVVYNTEQDITDPDGTPATQIRIAIQAGSDLNNELGRKLEAIFEKPLLAKINELKNLLNEKNDKTFNTKLRLYLRDLMQSKINSHSLDNTVSAIDYYLRKISDERLPKASVQGLRQDLFNALNSEINRNILRKRIAGNFYSQAAVPRAYHVEKDGILYPEGTEGGERREIMPMRWYNKETGKFAQKKEELKEGNWQMIPAEVVSMFHYADAFGIAEGTTMNQAFTFGNANLQRKITETVEEYEARLAETINALSDQEIIDGLKKNQMLLEVLVRRTKDKATIMNQDNIKERKDALVSYYSDFSKALDVITVRIPTTGTNLSQAGRIVEFFWGGSNTIILSQQKSILDGSDYDIDQLLVFFREFSDDAKLRNGHATKVFEAYNEYYTNQQNIPMLIKTMDMKSHIKRIDEYSDQTRKLTTYGPASSIFYDQSFRTGNSSVGYFANTSRFMMSFFHLPLEDRLAIFKAFPLLRNENNQAESAIDLTNQYVQLAVDNGKLNGLGAYNADPFVSNIIMGYMLSKETLNPVEAADDIVKLFNRPALLTILRSHRRNNIVSGNEYFPNLIGSINSKRGYSPEKESAYKDLKSIEAAISNNDPNVTDLDQEAYQKYKDYEDLFNYAILGEMAQRAGMLIKNITKIGTDNSELYTLLYRASKTYGMPIEEMMEVMAGAEYINDADAIEKQIEYVADNYRISDTDVEKTIRKGLDFIAWHKNFVVSRSAYMIAYLQLKFAERTTASDRLIMSDRVPEYLKKISKHSPGNAERNYILSEDKIKTVMKEFDNFVNSAYLSHAKNILDIDTDQKSHTNMGQVYQKDKLLSFDLSKVEERIRYVEAVVERWKDLSLNGANEFIKSYYIDINNATTEEYLRFKSLYNASPATLNALRQSLRELDPIDRNMFVTYNFLVYGGSRKKGSTTAIVYNYIASEIDIFMNDVFYPNFDAYVDMFLEQLPYHMPDVLTGISGELKLFEHKWNTARSYGKSIGKEVSQGEYEIMVPLYRSIANDYQTESPRILQGIKKAPSFTKEQRKEILKGKAIVLKGMFVIPKNKKFPYAYNNGDHVVTHDGVLLKIEKLNDDETRFIPVDEVGNPGNAPTTDSNQEITRTNEFQDPCAMTGSR